jgi:energy-coupling factor transporter ATP-binding protein EcfA2
MLDEYTFGLDVGEIENVVSAGRSLVTTISTVLYIPTYSIVWEFVVL